MRGSCGLQSDAEYTRMYRRKKPMSVELKQTVKELKEKLEQMKEYL